MLRVFLLAALFAVSSFRAFLGHSSGDALDAHLASILQSPQYAHSSFGISVYDLDSHRQIYGLNDRRYFLAASTTKLLTEGTTLSLLGPDYRFRTNVYRTGNIDADGTLHGDLVLLASGDPNLSGRMHRDGTLAFENEDHSYDGGPDTKAVPGDPLMVLNDFAQQIAARGITHVTGRVIVDDALYPSGFAELGTGAIVSPIMVNDNIVDVTVSPGAKAGDPTSFTVSPQTSYTKFVNRSTTAGKGSDRTISLADGDSNDAGVETVTIKGTLAQDSPSILYAYDVASPRRFAEMALTDELQRIGVDVEQSGVDARADHAKLAPFYLSKNVVASHVSAALSEDVKVTLKVSDNLHADTMPYLWAHGDIRKAFALERAFLTRGGLDADEVVQNDGLGGDAFIQPQFMVRYLAYLRRQPFFKTMFASLPVMGVDGTLYNIEVHSPAAGKVFAKTGTWGAGDALNQRGMISAKGLAGYMTTRSGRHIAFCFYINNLAVPHGEDAAHVAGEVLGQLATAAYLYAR
jgi:D-alanyl-D-alanine carboxypeptidase/D-alanyl-D-alanine-endopeptidase (penicillin-binding protein 4)